MGEGKIRLASVVQQLRAELIEAMDVPGHRLDNLGFRLARGQEE